MKGKLFVVSAPSGAGKTSIVRYILKEISGLEFSISATTRKRRPEETDGKEYYFISEEEFKRKIESDDFVEWEKFYDYYYGTLKSSIKDFTERGVSVLLEVDVKGAVSIKEKFSDAVLIFISPPSLNELKRRLIARNTETEIDLKKRLERAEMEMSYKDRFDFVVVNDNLDVARNKVKEIIKKLIN